MDVYQTIAVITMVTVGAVASYMIATMRVSFRIFDLEQRIKRMESLVEQMNEMWERHVKLDGEMCAEMHGMMRKLLARVQEAKRAKPTACGTNGRQ